MRSPDRTAGVADGVAGGVPVGSAELSSATGGLGGTTCGRRSCPEPAARAPPTSRVAATASSAHGLRPADRRSETGCWTGMAASAWRRSSGAVSLSPTVSPYHARNSLFQLSIVHRPVSVLSAAPMESCNCLSA